MHKLVKDETGNTYTRLTVTHRAPDARKALATWWCECVCGNVVAVPGSSLRNGNTKSCGCLALEAKSRTGKVTSKKNFDHTPTHGMSKSKPMWVYAAAKGRCTNPKNKDYARYGGRGIKFLFTSFQEFWRQMGDTYADGLTLERLDNDGPYSKENCVWATRMVQSLNTSTVRKIEYQGIVDSVSGWARRVGIGRKSMEERLAKWPLERALTEPPWKNYKRKNYAGTNQLNTQTTEQ